MSERSVKCPVCPFQFAHLVDAGDYHAYVCPACGWQKPTTDRRPGNRPADVCALCDCPIDLTSTDHHLYIGRGWVHGGGREYAPFHSTCIEAGREKDSFARKAARAWVAYRLGVDVDPVQVHEQLRAEQIAAARAAVA